jgi:hypothetical protein
VAAVGVFKGRHPRVWRCAGGRDAASGTRGRHQRATAMGGPRAVLVATLSHPHDASQEEER